MRPALSERQAWRPILSLPNTRNKIAYVHIVINTVIYVCIFVYHLSYAHIIINTVICVCIFVYYLSYVHIVINTVICVCICQYYLSYGHVVTNTVLCVCIVVPHLIVNMMSAVTWSLPVFSCHMHMSSGISFKLRCTLDISLSRFS